MIQIDLESSVPLEEQLCRAIREAMARGEVVPGDELPSSRQLGRDLGIHWNTVARAYRRLRDEGLLTIGRGRGVFARSREASDNGSPELLGRIEERIKDLLTEARLGGLSLDRVDALVKQQLEEWAEKEAQR